MHKNLAVQCVHVPEWVNNGEVALQVDESQVPDDQGMDQQVARTVHLYIRGHRVHNVKVL